MPITDAKILARRWFAAMNDADWNVITDLFIPSFIDFLPGQSEPLHIDAFKAFVANFNVAFPDIHHTIEDLIAEDDKVIVRWVARGTHTGLAMGVPPTNRLISVSGINIYRVSDGMFVEQWTEFDQLGMMQQMGVIPQMT
jgi:steroid delta-isomerase-like uncharacterized protein